MSLWIPKEENNLIVWTSKHTHTVFTWLSWFRKGIIQFSLLPLQAIHCLLTSPFTSPSPAVGWRGQWEAQKVKIMGKITTIYWKQQRDEKRKLMSVDIRKETLLLTMEAPKTDSTWLLRLCYLCYTGSYATPTAPSSLKLALPHCSSTLTSLEGAPSPQRSLSSPHLWQWDEAIQNLCVPAMTPPGYCKNYPCPGLNQDNDQIEVFLLCDSFFSLWFW